MCEKPQEKLFKPYFRTRVLDAAEPIDDTDVNTKFLTYMTEEILVDDVRNCI